MPNDFTGAGAGQNFFGYLAGHLFCFRSCRYAEFRWGLGIDWVMGLSPAELVKKPKGYASQQGKNAGFEEEAAGIGG